MPTGYWHLQTLWFGLIAVLWIGYFVLEGFDFGVGTLLPFLGRDDTDRRVIINTIGPVWDGNEVWLLVAGGATFAAFPGWYATLFSGFYLALFVILVALIVRGVAFEYRGKHDSPRWRAWWDRAIFIGSALPALLWGVAFGNIVRGVPDRQQPRVHRHLPHAAQPLLALRRPDVARALHPARRGLPVDPDEGRSGRARARRRPPALARRRRARVRVPGMDVRERRLGARQGHRARRDPALGGRACDRGAVHRPRAAATASPSRRRRSRSRLDHGHDLPQPVPAGDGVEHELGLRPDGLELVVEPLHARRDDGRRAGARARRPASTRAGRTTCSATASDATTSARSRARSRCSRGKPDASRERPRATEACGRSIRG